MRTSRNPRRRLRFGRLAVVAGVVLTGGGAVYALHTLQVKRNVGSLLGRAELAAGQKDHAAAAGFYRNYLKARPSDAVALSSYAETLEELAKAKPAVAIDLIQVYERLTTLEPGRAAERKRLVELYLLTQAVPNARTHLGRLFAAGPDDPALHELAAACDEREQKFADAVDHLRKVVAAGTAGPDVTTRLAALIRTEVGGAESVGEADRLVDALVTSRPNDPTAWLARSGYRRRFGNPAGARQDVEHVYNNLPGGADDPDVLATLADLLLEADDLPAAEKLLAKSAGGANPTTRTRITLADLQVRLGRLDAARQTLRDAAEKATRVDVYLLEVADRLIDLGEPGAAEKLTGRFAPLTDLGPVPDYLRGRLRLAAGDWPAAVPLLTAAADGLDRLTNQRFRAHLGLADAAGLANDTQGRLAAFEAAVRVNPASAVARLGRAECLAKLGRRQEAEEAFKELAAKEPAARAAVASLRLAEQLARPAADRAWEPVDVACGADPLPAEVAVVKARSLAARGRAADAVRLLDEATGRSAFPDAVVELASLKSAAGDRDGAFAVLDRAAQREVGDRPAFRLARARLLASGSPPDWEAVAALGRPSSVGQMTSADRFDLLAGLAEVYRTAGKPAEATDCWRRAAAERPNDLVSRAALYNLALSTDDASLQAELLADFERIEGKDGPVRTTAEAAKAVPALEPADAAGIARWRDKLTAARGERAGWGLVHHLLGRLEQLSGNGDAAAEAYRRAFDLGDRSDALVRGLYTVLLGRQRYAEAFELLGRLARERPLADDLAKELLRLQVAFGDDPARAAAWAKSAAAAGSTNDQDHLLRADALLAAGQPAAAVEPLKKAVSLNPANAVAWVALTRLSLALGKEVEANAVAAEAVRKLEGVSGPPGVRAAALTAAGICLELTGDAARAEAAYRNATAADPADVTARQAVVRLLTRTDRAADADGYLRGLTADAPPAVRRWARRELAFAGLDRPDWYGRLGAALALVEQNLTEGGGLPEDVRAKAIILGADPVRVSEAVRLLAAATGSAPPAVDHSYHLARLHLRQNRPDQAEATLKATLRTTPVPPPELLALMVKAQVQTGSVAAARETVERLKQLDPKGQATGVAEARVLAAEDKKPAAAARLTAAAGTAELIAVTAFAGPLLEEMGCPAEAEAVYRRATDPTAPLKLAGFLLRQKRPEDAVRALLPGDSRTPVGPAARLLAGAVRSKPPALLPEGERPNWETVVREVTHWVAAKSDAAPDDPHLLAARATLEPVVGRPERVVPAFERALAAAPDDPTAKANLAFARAVYNRDGSDATLALVQAAVERAGPSPALLDTRGVVHLAAGRAEPAIRDLSTALGLERKPAFAFHLARAYDLLAAGQSEYARRRDDLLADATRRGLTKAALDPSEWAEFDRLTGPPK